MPKVKLQKNKRKHAKGYKGSRKTDSSEQPVILKMAPVGAPRARVSRKREPYTIICNDAEEIRIPLSQINSGLSENFKIQKYPERGNFRPKVTVLTHPEPAELYRSRQQHIDDTTHLIHRVNEALLMVKEKQPEKFDYYAGEFYQAISEREGGKVYSLLHQLSV